MSPRAAKLYRMLQPITPPPMITASADVADVVIVVGYPLPAVVGPAHPEPARTFLLAYPLQVVMHLGVGL